MPENQVCVDRSISRAPSPAVFDLDVEERWSVVSKVKRRADFKFRSKPSSSLLCSRCSNLLADPVQTPCGHRYCASCIATMFDKKEISFCSAEGCDASLSRTMLFRDRSAAKEIKSLVVLCTGQEHGCNWEGTLEAISEHEGQCAFAAKGHDQVDSSSVPRPACDEVSMLPALLEKVRLLEADKQNSSRLLDKLVSVTDLLSRKMSVLEDRVTLLTSENNQLRHELQQVKSQSVGDTQTQLRAIDRTLAVNSVEMMDMRVQLDMLNVRQENGILVWKINDYARRFEEAKMNIRTAIYSQPFYTSPCGYKLCARLYLNGDGIGRGTHLSLFLVVMKGEYDAVLPWPFRQRITLTLLDQDSSSGHISETFDTDPTSNSFKRPTSELNIASGCPRFLSHTQLKESHTRGDNLFLKVEVDASTIPAPDRHSGHIDYSKM